MVATAVKAMYKCSGRVFGYGSDFRAQYFLFYTNTPWYFNLSYVTELYNLYDTGCVNMGEWILLIN
jgi:hypothetical protein